MIKASENICVEIIDYDHAKLIGYKPVAELIRCKDCKYFSNEHIYFKQSPDEGACLRLTDNPYKAPLLKETDYCSYADWREDDTDL